VRRFGVVLTIAVLAAACGDNDQKGGQVSAGPTPVPGAGTPLAPSLAPDVKLIWKAGLPMPTPRSEIAATELANELWVAGGFTADGKPSAKVEAYHPGRNEWREAPSLPHPVHHAAMAATGGLLYVIGGFLADGKATDEVWKMPPGGSQWTKADKLPIARGALAAAVVEGQIHAVGGATCFGCQGAKLSPEHDVFIVTDAAWKRLSPLPDARDHLAAAGLGSQLIVAGGRKLSLETNTNRMDIYDTDLQKWRRGDPMATARGGIAAAAWSGRVFVVGGEQPKGTFPNVEYYDPRNRTWTAGPNLPTARHGLAAVGFDSGSLVVVGGGPRPGLSVTGATELLSVAQ
jgi:N-acetylneuraminic acid mutarotase